MERNKILKYNLQKKAQPLYQDTIDRFFLKKEPRIVYTGPEISILQALLNDFQFCIGIKARWKDLKLAPKQKAKLKSILPTFASINLYCTCVELFSRIAHRAEPDWNKKETNEEFFKESAINWFGLQKEHAAQLWQLRNAISHHYKLRKEDHIAPKGTAGPVYKLQNDFWIFSIQEMYRSLVKAIDKFYKALSSEVNKKEYSDYINQNCFIYILPNNKP